MSELQVEAKICEMQGDFYEVKFSAVPRVGELIDLFSVVDQAKKLPPEKYYEVVQVVHNVRDVSEEIPHSINGSHLVTVFVKPSRSKFFKLGNSPSGPAIRN